MESLLLLGVSWLGVSGTSVEGEPTVALFLMLLKSCQWGQYNVASYRNRATESPPFFGGGGAFFWGRIVPETLTLIGVG